MKKSYKTKGDGSPIIKGDGNVVNNSFVNRHGKAFKVFIGIAFISCLIIIYKFTNIGVYDSFEEKVCITDRTSSGNIVNFIHYIVSNDNNIVYFDTDITTDDTEHSPPCKNNLRFTYDDVELSAGTGHIDGRYFFNDEDLEVDVIQVGYLGTSYYFNFRGLIDYSLVKKLDNNDSDLSDYADKIVSLLLDSHKIKPADNKKVLNDLSNLASKGYSGYNISVGLTPSSNIYTDISRGEEGYDPFLRGLVLIKSDWNGELTTYNLSAPNPSDVDNKKLQCTKLEKPKIVKFFVCPFL